MIERLPHITDETRDHIRRLIKLGMPYTRIAFQFGISEDFVRKVARKMKAEIRAAAE